MGDIVCKYFVSSKADCESLLVAINSHLEYTDRSHSFVAELSNGMYYLPIYESVCNEMNIDCSKFQEEEYIVQNLIKEDVEL